MPNASNYVDNLKAKGFSDAEIVALASVEAFGVVQDAEHARWSSFPKLDNYYYKQLMAGDDSMPLKTALNSSPELVAVVDQFAQDKAEYHKTFKVAYVKLCNLGTDESSLIDIEELLYEDPRNKLRFPEMYNM